MIGVQLVFRLHQREVNPTTVQLAGGRRPEINGRKPWGCEGCDVEVSCSFCSTLYLCPVILIQQEREKDRLIRVAVKFVSIGSAQANSTQSCTQVSPDLCLSFVSAERHRLAELLSLAE